MEKLILISQAVSLSVVFYIVIYFLTTWYWPGTLLSLFVCTFILHFLIGERNRAPRARLLDFVSAIVPDDVTAADAQLSRRSGRFTE